MTIGLRRDLGRELLTELRQNLDLEVVTPQRYRNEGPVTGSGTYR